MEQIISEINIEAKNYSFIEFALYSFKGTDLVIAGSADFDYYHNFEVIFRGVYTILSNITWKADPSKNVIEIVYNARDLNLKYRVISGNTVFRLVDEDNISHYVIAEKIEFRNTVVKY